MLVVDPGAEPERILGEIAARTLEPSAILVTHGHVDHVGGVASVAKATGVRVYMPAGEADRLEAPPDVALEGGEQLEIGPFAVQVLAVPGHSPAHIAYLVEDVLLSGDVLFAGSVGRTDIAGLGSGSARSHPAHARRGAAARDARLPGPRPRDHDRARARHEPVPRAPPMSERIEHPRATLDWLPPRVALRQHVIDVAIETFERAGFRQIVTPVFEDTALFARTAGETSDVVSKEMYTFADRSDRSLTLRPEGTAPVVRAYLEHGLAREPQPVRLWYVAPMYRYAAPQKGRYREHWQFGVEAIGSDDAAVDAEVIALQAVWYRALGLRDLELHLNSIGDPACRPAYREALVAYFEPFREQLSAESQARLERNPMRILDSKDERDR